MIGDSRHLLKGEWKERQRISDAWILIFFHDPLRAKLHRKSYQKIRLKIEMLMDLTQYSLDSSQNKSLLQIWEFMSKTVAIEKERTSFPYV